MVPCGPQYLRESDAKLEQDNIAMTTISDIFNIPSQVHQGDFVLRLTEGVTRPGDTLGTYVVTPQLEVCFDQALGLIKSALESNTSKGAYLHGSFGSGKSHFMAVLTLLLQSNPRARAIPELAAVVAKHNAWSQGRKFLLVPYHMIGATAWSRPSSGITPSTSGHCIRKPDSRASISPSAYSMMQEACGASMGDEAFFANLKR